MKRNFSIQKDIKIVLKEKGRKRLIEIENISHITCEGHISTVHTIDKKNLSVYKLLKQFEEELSDYNFVRTKNNCLCNLSFAEELQKINNKHFLKLKVTTQQQS